MGQATGSNPAMVYRYVAKADPGEFSLDGTMLAVLMQLDGKKDVGSLAKEQGLSLDALAEILSRLEHLGLAERVDESQLVVDQAFIGSLKSQLADVVGPIAGVLMEEAARELGYELSRFPENRAAELIVRLSQEIPLEDRREQFKENMLREVRQRGY